MNCSFLNCVHKPLNQSRFILRLKSVIVLIRQITHDSSGKGRFEFKQRCVFQGRPSIRSTGKLQQLNNFITKTYMGTFHVVCKGVLLDFLEKMEASQAKSVRTTFAAHHGHLLRMVCSVNK